MGLNYLVHWWSNDEGSIRGDLGTVGRGLEKGEGEMLEDDADVEVDEAGAGDIDPDSLDGEPQEELLGGDAGEGADLAVTERAGDVAVVMQLALELGVAGLIQVRLEPSLLVDLEIRHPLGQQPHGETVPRACRLITSSKLGSPSTMHISNDLEAQSA